MNMSIRKAVVNFVAGPVIVGATLLGASGAWAQQKAGSLKQQVLGTWSLVSQYVEQDGKKTERFGSDPKGISIYERNGQFVQVLQRRNLPKFASNNAMTGTADENKAVVQGSIAYFGTYTTNEKDGTMNSHVNGSTYPNFDGQDQQRKISISGDEMKSTLSTSALGGGAATSVWKRIK
jgi:hypothetical protein